MRKVIILTTILVLVSSIVWGAASVTKGKTFTSNETVTNTKLHTLVDSATIANVDQSNVAANYGLTEKSTTQPSDTDSLWLDSSNNHLAAYVSGAYEEVGITPSTLSTTTITATGLLTGANATFSDDVTAATRIVVSGAAPVAPTANALYADNIVSAWVDLSGSGSVTLNDDFNVTSVADGGVGKYTVTWDTDFASQTYACIAQTSGSSGIMPITTSKAAGSVAIWTTQSTDNAAADASVVHVIAIGDQ